MFAAIGFVIVLGAVFGSYIMAGGNLGIILHALPHEMLAIGGAAIGAFVVANGTVVMKGVLKGVPHAIKGPKWKKDDYRDLLVMLFMVASRIKGSGAGSLETDVDRPSESVIFSRFPRLAGDHHLMEFIADYVRMLTIEKIDAHTLAEAMDGDLERRHHQELAPQHALQVMADGLPAIGIVAAVLGVIKTMGSIDQPTEVLGGMIGGALVGTFLGVLLSYCVVGPIAARLKQVIDEEHLPLAIARNMLVRASDNTAPSVVVEIGRRQVPLHFAPGFTEMEQACAEVKSALARGPALSAAA